MPTVVDILEERCRREREILFACFDVAAKAKDVDISMSASVKKQLEQNLDGLTIGGWG